MHVAGPLASGDFISSEADQAWYAVATRPRHEKMVVARLQSQGVDTYLPVAAEVHRWSDRRKVVYPPVFPGYAFIHAHLGQSAAAVKKTDGVLGILGNGRQAIPIPDREIESVQKLLASDRPWEMHPFLRIGQRVRIRGGAFDGLEGILLERKGDDRVVVSIELIQRSLAVRLEGYDIEQA